MIIENLQLKGTVQRDGSDGKYVLSKEALLKVVCNEKGGGSGSWQMFEDGFGPWRSMSVCFLIVVFSSTYFRFRFVKPSGGFI